MTFGSYAPNDVTWLLKDLSGVRLEKSLTERERSIQSGRHYWQDLPQEYQPSSEYMALYRRALALNAQRVAQAVVLVAEESLRVRGKNIVIVSLARAGVPIGVLMKRWYAKQGMEVSHYAISILRDKGIDENALKYIFEHHRPEDVMFVDGWTGKGAITRELRDAVETFNASYGTRLSSDLAVLADPAYCATHWGTRDDFLIPSACLNSTVSGLVSRTVFRDDLIGDKDFHGAKYYSDLTPSDVSNEYINAIAEHFPSSPSDVGTQSQKSQGKSDWRGERSLRRVMEHYQATDLNMVKPGIGETTRALLRRVPERILINPNSAEDLSHVLSLAEERSVPVEPLPFKDVPYNCISLSLSLKGEQ